MKIVTLLENDTSDKKLSAAHGLSLYIETNTKKILFDLGPNNYYMKNAKKLGIDLAEVDILVISHGHNDHGTGLKQFLKYNKKAQVYLSKRIFEDHVKLKNNRYIDIGIGKQPKSDRLNFIKQERKEISPGIFICDMVNYEKQKISDVGLMTYEDGQYVNDHFHHEIYLVINDGRSNVLFTGCSHKGIENIVESIQKISKKEITHIFGGLHLSHYDSFNFKQTDYLIKLGSLLPNKGKTNVYAGHCTGEDAFFELKKEMRDNLHRIKTGSMIEI
jgi:7,8-dihydropterin-6-yl-methyl-4-(beta-D-ribofuranosyl)aminobenzene 5'-phosphate synthase